MGRWQVLSVQVSTWTGWGFQPSLAWPRLLLGKDLVPGILQGQDSPVLGQLAGWDTWHSKEV